jgi:hypothetical protein
VILIRILKILSLVVNNLWANMHAIIVYIQLNDLQLSEIVHIPVLSAANCYL